MAAEDNMVRVFFSPAFGEPAEWSTMRELSVGERVYKSYELRTGEICIRDKGTMAGWDVKLVELIQALRGD